MSLHNFPSIRGNDTYEIGGCLSQTLLLPRRLSLYCLTTREMAAVLVFYNCRNVKQYSGMKKEKKVLTKCVEAKKVQEFFNKISDLITSGHDKVWTSKDENGEMNFIVGNSRVNIRINTSMMKGGTL